ncbi:cytochrome P450, partial [Streptomyces sp. SID2955]|nr:cytochrome P450 [Streptomyces sp. SID2955]
ERNLICNALLLLLSPGAGGRESGMLIEEAIDHVLWNQTPIANYATHYPVQDVDLGGVVAEAGTPVVISFAAANSDPVLAEARRTHSKGAHLAWGAGPHACPAKDPAQVIAVTAIEKILNALPDLTLAVHEKELQWRPGPFHRALVELPVAFSPTPATRVAAAVQGRSVPAATEQPLPTAPTAVTRPEPARRKGFWSTFLDLFRV